MKKPFLVLCLLSVIISCKKDKTPAVDYRQEMRDFVQGISTYARNIKPGFIIVPQNGQDLLTTNGKPDGPLSTAYIHAIDGVGREDLFYGYDQLDVATSVSAMQDMLPFMDVAKNNGLKVMATDYCSTPSNIDNSFFRNSIRGYISFAADHLELDDIPSYPAMPNNADTNTINTLADAKNFLYLIDPSQFDSKQSLISRLAATDYDVIIMDLNFNDEFFNASEINALKHKNNGALRRVICYMSIGEAEDYRYYWQKLWKGVPPQWMAAEDPQWAGNYKVKYWDKEWQSIIYGNTNSYTNRVITAGFDGVYLDIIDAFEYFEN